MDIYLHGIETIESNAGPRAVETIDTGVVGLIGTAPAANATIFPLNTVVPIYGYQGLPSGLGSSGTLPDALDAIFDQATRASQTICMVRVEEGGTANETMGNVIGSRASKTGLHALRNAPGLHNLVPKLLVAPGFTSTRPTDGVASATITNAGSGYTEAPTVTVTGGGGSGATVVATINEEGAVDSLTVVNPGMGYATAPTLTFSGGGGSGAAGTVTCGSVANPVTAELLALAKAFRAGVIVDGPNTNAAAAVTYRLDWSDPNLYIVDPFVKIMKDGTIVSQPAAARLAGLQARVDYDEGFWVSMSNHVVAGIVGTARTIEHSLSDPSVESQYLNKNGVGAIVRSPSGGFKLWGARAACADTANLFWSVRRAHNTIMDSIEKAHEPFIDRPFSLQVLLDIAETVNSAMRRWQRLGATLGSRVWLDPQLNTKETWMAGHLYVSYDAEAPAPIEHLTFVFNRNTGYYEMLADNAVREIARLAASAV